MSNVQIRLPLTATSVYCLLHARHVSGTVKSAPLVLAENSRLYAKQRDQRAYLFLGSVQLLCDQVYGLVAVALRHVSPPVQELPCISRDLPRLLPIVYHGEIR